MLVELLIIAVFMIINIAFHLAIVIYYMYLNNIIQESALTTRGVCSNQDNVSTQQTDFVSIMLIGHGLNW
jgi:hypothetical protein